MLQRNPKQARSRQTSLDITGQDWSRFITNHPHGHLLQTRPWGELKALHGWRALHSTVVSTTHKILGVSLILTRTLPRGLGKLAYVPRGPVVDWDNEEFATATVNTTSKLARRHGAIALIIEPDLFDTPSDQHLLSRCGLQPLPFTVQPRRTVLVNLDVDEEVDILAGMKQKTRYNIGLARRKGVVIRTGNIDDAAVFYNMMQTTADRDTFSIHPYEYYRDFLSLFAPDNDEQSMARLFIAEYQGQPLAAVIATAVGKRAIYLYGASTNEKRELMPTYLLQWEAMLWARSKGCVSYDLWGVPDEDESTLEAQFEQRNDGLWGVYRFKRGFGGQVVRHIGAWVKVFSPLRWWLYQQASRLRKTHGLGG